MKYYQWSSWSNWEKLASQPLNYLATEPWGDADILFFLKLKAIIVGLAFLKAGFNKKNPAQVLLTWLMQGKQTLLALTDLLLQNGKTKIFRFVTP